MYLFNTIKTLFLALGFTVLTACSAEGNSKPLKKKDSDADLSKYQTAYFAAGCFWCVEAVFESVKGVKETVSGYSGGTEQNPTYHQVGSGKTGHAESVKVYYDPTIVSYKTLVDVYYGSHDPTTVNGQHPDYGKQYRSIVFYQTEDERQTVESYIDQLEKSGTYDKPIATEVVKFKKFWDAEDYHQDYVQHHPGNSYVQRISLPRLKNFQDKFPELIKPERKL